MTANADSPLHIGIIACSAEGAALCYRTICAESAAILGEHRHPEVSMHTFCLADYMRSIRAGDWRSVGEMMLASARKLRGYGAELLICPDNTIHEAVGPIRDKFGCEFLHIAEQVGLVARDKGYKKLAITGTKYLMTGPVYPSALSKLGLECEIPDEADRLRINEIIFSRLTYGDICDADRLYFNEVYAAMAGRGCDAAVLGCTEIPLLVDPDDCPLPTLDSTRLLARAALKYSIGQ